MRFEILNEGDGARKHAVYDMPIRNRKDYWSNVTDVTCPVCQNGTIRWNEAGFVPGSRICDRCGRFFQAHGSISSGSITLVRDKRFDRKPIKPCENCRHLERLIVVLTEARDANAVALKATSKVLEMANDKLTGYRAAVDDLEQARRDGDQLAEQSAISRLVLLSYGPQEQG